MTELAEAWKRPGIDGASLDTRFVRLAGREWGLLPAAIRRRFSHRLHDGERVLYLGNVARTRITRLGWLIARAATLVGAPLPLEAGGRMPVAVIVTGCERLGGQIWTRIYDRQRRLPQVIQSIKRFSGATGLEEMVGWGVGMRLVLSVENRALVFRSAGYFLRCLRMQIPIPAWLTPGEIEVVHREERAGRFSFSLSVTHPWGGRIIDQVAFFREARPPIPPKPGRGRWPSPSREPRGSLPRHAGVSRLTD